MSLYTGKGDDGTTTTFSCDQRISKSSAITEALGSLDEINSFLGICKVLSQKENLYLENDLKISSLIHSIQNDLFTVQAEVAGADKNTEGKRIAWLEMIISEIEKELPPIKSFLISGGSELSSSLDFARTLVRRAERRVVAVHEEKIQKISKNTLIYLNRLSSLFYVLVRFVNLKKGQKETKPRY